MNYVDGFYWLVGVVTCIIVVVRAIDSTRRKDR